MFGSSGLASEDDGVERRLVGTQRFWAAIATCGTLVGIATFGQLCLISWLAWWPTVLLDGAAIGFVSLVLLFFDRVVDDVSAASLTRRLVPAVLMPGATLAGLVIPSSFPWWVNALIGLAVGFLLSVSVLGSLSYLQFALTFYGALAISTSSLLVGLITFGLSFWMSLHPLWISLPVGLLTSALSMFALLKACRFLPSLSRRQWG